MRGEGWPESLTIDGLVPLAFTVTERIMPDGARRGEGFRLVVVTGEDVVA